ncbi:Retinoid isomerohydrolase [Branchiostoma belcheri]|nr:Retinoid isomerohydrolase [Branchiostoma belcheri]
MALLGVYQLSGDSGSIPPWLAGSLMRTGPGKFEVGKEAYRYWFDGLAIVHKFNIKDGKVTYQSRFLETEAYREAMKAQRIVLSEYGTMAYPDPCKNIFARFFSYFFPPDMSDNDLVNTFPMSDEFFCVNETYRWTKLDPRTLDTLGQIDLTKYIAVNALTAHPHHEPDGTVYNMGSSYSYREGCQYNIVRFDPVDRKKCGPEATVLENASIVCSIPASFSLSASYYHSFGMTQNYFVFIEQPLYMNIPKILLARIQDVGVTECFDWHTEIPCRFVVVRREDGEIVSTKYLADSFFSFHHINTYEEDGHLVLDLCCFEDARIVKLLYLSHLRRPDDEKSFPEPQCRRYCLPLNLGQPQCRRYCLPFNLGQDEEVNNNAVRLSYTTATACLQPDGSLHCQPEHMSSMERGFEFPTINYTKYNGKPYRYFYGTGLAGAFTDSLFKMDVKTKKLWTWREKHCYGSELIFVPDPDGVEEDDGVLLATVVDVKDEAGAFLLVLDGKTFTELGRAVLPAPVGRPQLRFTELGRAVLPAPVGVGYSLHGCYVPEASPGEIFQKL